MLCDVPAMSITLDWRREVSANKGIKPRKTRKRSQDYKAVYDLYMVHKSLSYVASVFNMHQSGIRYIISKYAEENNL